MATIFYYVGILVDIGIGICVDVVHVDFVVTSKLSVYILVYIYLFLLFVFTVLNYFIFYYCFLLIHSLHYYLALIFPNF